MTALARLEARLCDELAMLAYPSRRWVRPRRGPDGEAALDVAIVGAGQSGLALAFALRRAGVSNLAVFDRSGEGCEGPWSTVARMNELRTPKYQVGMEGGVPSLSMPAWYRAVHGDEAWDAIERVPRSAWIDYLRWFRRVTGAPVHNETTVELVEPGAGLVELQLDGPNGRRRAWARHVVLCTGFDGGGSWYVPEHIAAAVPPDAVLQANLAYDPARMRGRRIGVLGHGASAFDAAATALEAGAASVDLCFRRAALPAANPHRCVEFRGFLDHFADLDDATRWRVALHFERHDQPPALDGYRRARRLAGFRMHAGANWQRVQWQGDRAEVDTGAQRFAFDLLVCATGLRVDLRQRPELAAMEPSIARWQDRFEAPEGERDAGLASHPYLGRGYELTARSGVQRTDGGAELSRVVMFNGASFVSCGPHSTSISGLGSSVPRVVRHLTRRLMREQGAALLDELANYREDTGEYALEDPVPTASAKTDQDGAP